MNTDPCPDLEAFCPCVLSALPVRNASRGALVPYPAGSCRISPLVDKFNAYQPEIVGFIRSMATDYYNPDRPELREQLFPSPSAMAAEISRVEGEVKAVERRLAHLKVALETLDRYQKLLPPTDIPIFRLPVEILTEVFHHLQCHVTIPMRQTNPLVNLQLVCRHWYNVVKAHTPFWATIKFEYASLAYSQPIPGVLGRCVQAKGTPVSLIIQGDGSAPTPEQRNTTREIVEHFCSWRALCIDNVQGFLPEIPSGMVLPLLESLDISGCLEENTITSAYHGFDFLAPALHTVRLSSWWNYPLLQGRRYDNSFPMSKLCNMIVRSSCSITTLALSNLSSSPAKSMEMLVDLFFLVPHIVTLSLTEDPWLLHPVLSIWHADMLPKHLTYSEQFQTLLPRLQHLNILMSQDPRPDPPTFVPHRALQQDGTQTAVWGSPQHITLPIGGILGLIRSRLPSSRELSGDRMPLKSVRVEIHSMSVDPPDYNMLCDLELDRDWDSLDLFICDAFGIIIANRSKDSVGDYADRISDIFESDSDYDSLTSDSDVTDLEEEGSELVHWEVLIDASGDSNADSDFPSDSETDDDA